MSWYALFVQTGYEDDVCRYLDKVREYMLQDITYRLLVPKRKIYERKQGIRYEVIKLMFPGYVFIETDSITQFYKRAKGSPHIIKFLKEKDFFYEIQLEEISRILFMADHKGLINLSLAYVVDDKISICAGPLLGQEGIIRRIDRRKGRVKVEFIVNNQSVLVDLGINIIRKLS
ncbi:antiterminator LoaP [Anaerosporobacter faecicola]|uniref:antiterminator LoaP n=1 Tax=Anaerosporobacter faecicola TaxID=2718714 RepID=UPI00143884E1|nr:antiterminator LoaP [Anaerosporobacter faecicola]